MKRRRVGRNIYWPWAVQVFAPRCVRYPVIHSGDVFLSDGQEVPVQVSLLTLDQNVEVLDQAKRRAGKTSPSAKETARIVASCVSGIFLVTRRGRDVVLPKYTEMDIAFDRPVTYSLVMPKRGQSRGLLWLH